jgi:C_GCAxxG_C_C family probable redox protein
LGGFVSAESLGEKANRLHLDGYNCSQAVLLVLYEYLYPNEQNPVIPKVAAGFGGGMGRCGSVCGALTGAIMAVGLKYGANENNPQKKLETYAKTQALFKQFQKEHGSVMCRDLIHLDLSNPQQLEKAKQEKVFETQCSRLIKAVVKDFLALEKP